MNQRERMEALLAGHVLKVGSTLYRLDNEGNLEHMNSTRIGWEANRGTSILSNGDASIADDYTLTFSQANAMMNEGYGEAHFSGYITYTVNAVGECDRLVDDRGFTIGTVPDAVKVVGRGGQQRTGILRLFNQEITFDWRWFPTTGNQFLYLKLGRLFFDPKVYSDPADIRALFIQRARFVEYALAINGWVLTRSDKGISGQIHVAWEHHPLCRHFDPDYQDSNEDLTFAQAVGKLAEGRTVTCRATHGRRYRLVDGTLSEVHSDGRSQPVDSFDDLQMGSVWRVVEVPE